jgi:hypothetical protein
VAFSAFYFSACRKDALDYSTLNTTPEVEVQSPIDRESKDNFFQSTSNLQPEFQLLIANLKGEDSLKNFITHAWVQKNGLPVWDKTLTNNTKSLTRFDEAESNLNVYFTPLKSTSTGIIQSYILSYQKGQSQYHRLYNIDDLKKNKPANDNISHQLKHLFAPFAFFENQVNNNPSLSIGQPFNYNFDKINVVFNASSKDKLKTRSVECIEIEVMYAAIALVEDNHTEIMCWDVPSSGSSSSSGGGWSSSGVGSSNSHGGTTSWSGSSYSSLNISDLISALIGEIPLQQILSLYPNDVAFINFVANLKNSGQSITEGYAERLYASYDKYTQAGFSSAEVAAICKDNTFFQQVNAFLDVNGFTNENRLAVKGFNFLMDIDDDFKALNQNRGNKSIKQLLDEFGFPKISASTMMGLARKNGVTYYKDGKEEINFFRLGRIQEDAVIRSIKGVLKNTKAYQDPLGQRISTIPDIVTEGITTRLENGIPKEIWSNPQCSFLDSKFTATGLIKDNITTNDQGEMRQQLSTMIDVLANMKEVIYNSLIMRNWKPADHGIATLTIVTIHDAAVDPSLINQALTKNVRMHKRWLELDVETLQIKVSTNFQLTVNPATNKGADMPTLRSDAVDFNWTVQ